MLCSSSILRAPFGTRIVGYSPRAHRLPVLDATSRSTAFSQLQYLAHIPSIPSSSSRQICAGGRLARQLRARELVARSWAVIVLPRFAFPRRTHQLFHVIRGVMTRARAYFFIVIFIRAYCSRHHPATISIYPSYSSLANILRSQSRHQSRDGWRQPDWQDVAHGQIR